MALRPIPSLTRPKDIRPELKRREAKRGIPCTKASRALPLKTVREDLKQMVKALVTCFSQVLVLASADFIWFKSFSVNTFLYGGPPSCATSGKCHVHS